MQYLYQVAFVKVRGYFVDMRFSIDVCYLQFNNSKLLIYKLFFVNQFIFYLKTEVFTF